MPTPTKFTARVKADVLEAFGWGASIRDAAGYAGIDHKTLLRWLKEGEEAGSGAKWEFWRDVQAARAAPKLRVLKAIHDEIPNNTGLAKWYAERQIEGFAPPQPAVSQAPSGPIVINLALADGAPVRVPNVIEGEVVDESDSRSLPAPSSTG